MGVPILPLDANASIDEYRVERLRGGTLGIRLSLRDVHGISDAELDRLLAGQPFGGITDLYERARPSRALMQRLALVGALDSLALPATPADAERREQTPVTVPHDHPPTRGDVIAFVRQLTAKRPARSDPDSQLDFTIDDRRLIPRGNPQFTAADRARVELGVLDMDASEHLIDAYRPLLDDMGVTPANQLLALRSKTEVLVAGVRIATQTPPMRSGKRVVFISLDDGSGCADATFFEEAQQTTGPRLFGTKLMVIRGRTRRTGERGISIEAIQAWDLKQLWAEFCARRHEYASGATTVKP
jgi:error-prone DNA polymerase